MGHIIDAINRTLWGAPMLILLFGSGIYLTLKLRFFQLFGVREWMRETLGSLFRKKDKTGGDISPYSALSAALAATVGNGNIVGVATAIAAGGAGAVFWMWVSAFFGMATKYTEIYLAVKFRRKKDGSFYGGPMYYIESGLGKEWRWLAYLFSLSGTLACLGMGAMNQANSIAGILYGRMSIPVALTGAVLAVFAAVIISGGIKKVSRVTEALVPVMSLLYVGAGAFIMLINPAGCIAAIGAIFKGAFAKSAVLGGMSGAMMKHAIRFGVARGVFSNEAGLGSSPIIHATADAKSPRAQGFWGVFEVFMDTFVICTVTALIILTGAGDAVGLTGAGLVSCAFFSYMGIAGSVFVEICTILFALTTILGWSYYGESCLAYLSGERKTARRIYRVAFCLAVFLGSVSNVGFIWELSDMFNGMMMVPNLIAVILLSDIVIGNK